MNRGDEVHIHAGRHAGKFGRIMKVWRTGYQVRINNECVGGGPKFATLTGAEVSPISGIELLARLGKRAS